VADVSISGESRFTGTIVATFSVSTRSISTTFGVTFFTLVLIYITINSFIHCRWLYGSIFIQIFLVGSAKIYWFCTSEVWVSDVQGHPSSLTLVPIESTYATSW